MTSKFFSFEISLLLIFRSTSHIILAFSTAMDITQIYAIAAGGFFAIFLFFNFLPYTARFREKASVVMSKHLTYPYLIDRHRILSPWTRADILIKLIYITVNLFCLGFRTSTISEASLRAGTLSLINITPLFTGPHLGFLANIFGFPLHKYQRLHRSAGLISFTCIIFHVLVVLANGTSFPLSVSEHLYGLIIRLRAHFYLNLTNWTQAGSSLLLLMLSYPFLRRLSHEAFLRIHQMLAILCAFAL